MPGLLLKAVIGACDEMLAELKATHVHPVPRSDMTVRAGVQPRRRRRNGMRCARVSATPRSAARRSSAGGFVKLNATEGETNMVTVGSGEYIYEPVENWAKLPPGWSFKEIGGVGVDRNDNVYVFNRGEHPMIVFDRDGNFLRSWGEGCFPRAHGVFMAPDDTIWLTDDGDHTVRQCTLEGKVLLTLGISGKPAPYMSGEPFHRCTHTAHVAAGRHLCVRRLRQFARAQIRAERQAAAVVGRARHRSGRVQHRAQHHLRCRRLGLCGRPREPSRAGVRRQRQVRDAVEQPAPAVRPVHAAGQMPDLLHRRTWRRCSRSTATCRISGRA